MGKTLYQPIVDKETGEIIVPADILIEEKTIDHIDEKWCILAKVTLIEVKIKTKDGTSS